MYEMNYIRRSESLQCVVEQFAGALHLEIRGLMVAEHDTVQVVQGKARQSLFLLNHTHTYIHARMFRQSAEVYSQI